MKAKNLLTLVFTIVATISFAQKTVTGTITSVKGKTFVLKCEGDNASLAKGDSCNISKDISGSKNPFGITVSSGWLGVGKGVVSAADKNNLTIKIVKETSEIIINGKKTEHFVAGKKMKLER